MTRPTESSLETKVEDIIAAATHIRDEAGCAAEIIALVRAEVACEIEQGILQDVVDLVIQLSHPLLVPPSLRSPEWRRLKDVIWGIGYPDKTEQANGTYAQRLAAKLKV